MLMRLRLDFELSAALAIPALAREPVNSCRDRELPSNIEEKRLGDVIAVLGVAAVVGCSAADVDRDLNGEVDDLYSEVRDWRSWWSGGLVPRRAVGLIVAMSLNLVTVSCPIVSLLSVVGVRLVWSLRT